MIYIYIYIYTSFLIFLQQIIEKREKERGKKGNDLKLQRSMMNRNKRKEEKEREREKERIDLLSIHRRIF